MNPNAKSRVRRAANETTVGWRKEIIAAVIVALLVWLFLPRSQAKEELTAMAVAALGTVIVLPFMEFLWNLVRLPSKGIVDVGAGHELEGRWYGNRFVPDQPVQDFVIRLDSGNRHALIVLLCPPDVLGTFSYEMDGLADVAVREPGSKLERMLGGGGTVEVPVNGLSQVELELTQGSCNLSWFTHGWTARGK